MYLTELELLFCIEKIWIFFRKNILLDLSKGEELSLEVFTKKTVLDLLKKGNFYESLRKRNFRITLKMILQVVVKKVF